MAIRLNDRKVLEGRPRVHALYPVAVRFWHEY